MTRMRCPNCSKRVKVQANNCPHCSRRRPAKGWAPQQIALGLQVAQPVSPQPRSPLSASARNAWRTSLMKEHELAWYTSGRDGKGVMYFRGAIHDTQGALVWECEHQHRWSGPEVLGDDREQSAMECAQRQVLFRLTPLSTAAAPEQIPAPDPRRRPLRPKRRAEPDSGLVPNLNRTHVKVMGQTVRGEPRPGKSALSKARRESEAARRLKEEAYKRAREVDGRPNASDW